MNPVVCADLFCGGGGTSTGLARACLEAGIPVELLAVNHWQVAIETHRANHPWARHLCASIESVNPLEAVPGGRLGLLVAAPECTHHSVARGGRPIDDQKRASPWYILRWPSMLHVESMLIENVPEFQSWGPIGKKGRPLKAKKGAVFQAYLQSIRALGYEVDYRVLNAADYGDATSRRRLFIQARRGGLPITWPKPSHSKGGTVPGTRLWRAAREVIDWGIPGTSIFHRKRPLADSTMRRIVEGLRRFGGPGLDPFLVKLRGTSTASSVDDPVPTVTAGGTHLGVAEPFLLGQQSGGAPRAVSDPMPTIAAGGAIALVEGIVLPPLGVHSRGGKANKARPISDPLPTITAGRGGRIGLIQPFIIPFFGERPGQDARAHSLDDPLPTVTSHGAGGLVEPHIVSYNGNGKAHSVDEPVPALTTRDRFALVQPIVDGMMLDIRFRMLQPHELSAAMGFPAGYRFAGKRADVIRQIGNAVAVNIAKALCAPLLTPKVAS